MCQILIHFWQILLNEMDFRKPWMNTQTFVWNVKLFSWNFANHNPQATYEIVCKLCTWRNSSFSKQMSYSFYVKKIIQLFFLYNNLICNMFSIKSEDLKFFREKLKFSSLFICNKRCVTLTLDNEENSKMQSNKKSFSFSSNWQKEIFSQNRQF